MKANLEKQPPTGEDILPVVWRWRIVLVAAAVVVLWLGYLLRGVLMPFLLAWIAAYLVSPTVNFLHRRWKMSRQTATTVVCMVSVLLIVIILIALIPPIINQSVELFQKMPEYMDAIELKVQELREQGRIPPQVEDVIRDGLANTGEQARKFAPQIAQMTGKFLLSSLRSIAGIFGFAFSVLIFLFVFFFFLRDFPVLNENIVKAVPARFRSNMETVLSEMNDNLRAVLRGQLTVAIIMAVLYGIGLTVVGVPYGIVIGFVAGLGNFLPYIGPTLGLIPAFLFVFIEQGWSLTAVTGPAIGIAVVFGLVQFLEGFFLTPRFAGESVGLGPVATLFAISAGGVLLGIFGVVAALPVAAISKVGLKHIWSAYIESEFFTMGK